MARDTKKTELTCVHRLPLFLMSDDTAPGIILYLHWKEGEKLKVCEPMNEQVDIVYAGPDEDVHGIAYMQAPKFGTSPEFRAAFLASLEVRKRVYNFIAKLKTHRDTEQALRLVVALITDAWNADTIYGELYGVFGVENVKTNIRLACGNIPGINQTVMEVDVGQSFSMFDLKGQRIQGIQDQIEEDAARQEARVKKAQQYAKDRITQRYG